MVPEAEKDIMDIGTGEDAESVAFGLFARRREERQRFLDKISEQLFEEYSFNDDCFQTALRLAINDYGVSRQELAALTGVSEPQVGRWIAGQSMPRPYGRPRIMTMLAKILKADLDAQAKNQARRKMRPRRAPDRDAVVA